MFASRKTLGTMGKFRRNVPKHFLLPLNNFLSNKNRCPFLYIVMYELEVYKADFHYHFANSVVGKHCKQYIADIDYIFRNSIVILEL